MSLLKTLNKNKKSQLLSIAFMSVLSFAVPIEAQNSFSAAYRVNSAVITHYEIDQMGLLMSELGRAITEDPRELAVETLINDRLLRQETARFNISVDPVLIDRALENIGGDATAFRKELNSKGIADQTIDTYVGSQILLRSYLDIRGIQISVSPEEMASRINNIPDQVTQTVHVAEIVLPYAEYGGRIPTRFKLNEIEDEMRAGKSFTQIARDVSRAPTATNGGRLPEIPREALNPELASIIAPLSPGQISSPIETEGAIILIQYVGSGEIRQSLPRSPYVSYVELFVPAREGLEKSKNDAQYLSRTVQTCERAKATQGATIKDNVAVNELSSGISLALARLETGANGIFERENGTSVLYLCDLGVNVPEEVQAGVNNLVQNDAMDARTRGVMQELRNIAVIEKVQ